MDNTTDIYVDENGEEWQRFSSLPASAQELFYLIVDHANETGHNSLVQAPCGDCVCVICGIVIREAVN